MTDAPKRKSAREKRLTLQEVEKLRRKHKLDAIRLKDKPPSMRALKEMELLKAKGNPQ